jgi:outer membrane protein TolC
MIFIKKIKYKLLIISILASIHLCNAQSLDALLTMSKTENLDLKVLEQSYQAALHKGAQFSERPDPEFTAGIFALPIETRLGVQRLRVGAMQMFPQKGLLKAKVDLWDSAAKEKFHDIAARSLNLDYQLKQAYFQFYFLEKSKAIIARNIPIYEIMERLTLTKVESGKGNAAEVLKVQLKIQELKQELELIEVQKKNPQIFINQLLNRDLNETLFIEDSLELAVLPYAVDSLATQIANQHPLIKKYNSQQETAHKSLVINKLSQKPSFGIGLDYIWMDKIDNFEFAKNGRDVIMPKASLKIPIYKKKYGAKEQEENLKIAALETQKEATTKLFLSKIEQAFKTYEALLIQLDLYQKQIRTTQGVINILKTQYSSEGKGFDELLEMQATLINYDLLKLKAIVDSHLAKAKIEQFLN